MNHPYYNYCRKRKRVDYITNNVFRLLMDRSEIYWDSFLPAFFDRMSVMMKKNMTDLVSDYGITGAHAIYLIALRLQDGQTLVEISRFLDLDTSNTNRVVKVLRDEGLIYDDRKSDSNKKYRIFLTEKGAQLADYVMEKIIELNNSYLKGIPYKDIIQMRRTLMHIMDNMGVDLEEYIGSKYTSRFYTYLQLNPEDADYPIEYRRVENSDRYHRSQYDYDDRKADHSDQNLQGTEDMQYRRPPRPTE